MKARDFQPGLFDGVSSMALILLVKVQSRVFTAKCSEPQVGPLSVVCSNIYLDKLDKELEQRGHRFTRYADDVLVFTKSEQAANRVMESISGWLERKLSLKVNATKTKVVRPTRRKKPKEKERHIHAKDKSSVQPDQTGTGKIAGMGAA